MFRVTRDNFGDSWPSNKHFYYVHKKFLWFWVKWSNPKSNMCSSVDLVFWKMKTGQYEFNSGEYGTYFMAVAEAKPEDIKYYDNAEDFRNQNIEYFI